LDTHWLLPRKGNGRRYGPVACGNYQIRENGADYASPQAILDGVADWIVVVGADYRIRSLNRRARNATGAALSSTCYEALYQQQRPCGDAGHPCPLDLGREAGEPMVFERLRPPPNGCGQPQILEISATPLLDENGGFAGIIKSVRDITARTKKSEERHRIAHLEAVGALAGGLAHDFNNLLTVITGHLSLAKITLDPLHLARQDMVAAENASLEARNLVRQLLHFSHFHQPQKKTMSLKTLLRETAQSALSNTGNQCTFSIAGDLWPAAIDPDQMAQVIRHLIANARDAVAGGGAIERSEERRVGKECRSRWSPYH